jgi:hypothetical protein
MHLIKLSILITVLTSSVLIQSSFLTLLAKEQWVEVVSSLGSAVDLNSIRKVSNEYEARLRGRIPTLRQVFMLRRCYLIEGKSQNNH